MTDRARRAALILPLALLAGCGGSSAGSSTTGTAASPLPTAANTSPSPAAAPTSSVVSGSAPQASGTAPAASQPSAAMHGTLSPSPRPSPIVLDAKLSATCVTPGGSMTLTLHARPAMTVIFDTRYADDKDGQVHGGFEQNGRTDAKGDYSKTWQVDPLTPVGDADTTIAAVDQQGSGRRRLLFRVARTC